MLKIVFKTCKNETLMTSYSHFTKFFSRKILKHFTQDRSTYMYSTYVERSQPGLMYRQKPTEDDRCRGVGGGENMPYLGTADRYEHSSIRAHWYCSFATNPGTSIRSCATLVNLGFTFRVYHSRAYLCRRGPNTILATVSIHKFGNRNSHYPGI